MNRMTCAAALIAAAIMAGCASAPGPTAEQHAGHDGAAATEGAVPLYDNLGDYHFEISTDVPAAQQYFDQGLRLAYAFNHGEAIRAFEEAARLDPECAICHWGIAYSYGPNINAPMDSAGAAAAYAALQQAQALASHASDRERAYIDALAVRYVAEPSDDRAALDSAYAEAMRELADQYPDDPDAATLRAEAMMDLRPWAYWTLDGEPQPGTPEILSRLEAVIERDPDHPGACHFYIHAVEAAQPEKAVACAERLAGAMPGAGHLVHMPAHIYIRVGRWDDAIEVNQHATHADESYLADQPAGMLYRGMYYPHNYHFLAFAGIMSGRSELAIESARATAERVPPEAAKGSFLGEPLFAYPHLTLAAFGRWTEVLDEPMPPSELPLATVLTHYARGLAYSALNQTDDAQAALDMIVESAEAFEAAEASTMLDIARYSLGGDMAARSGDVDVAIEQFSEAARLEDGLYYIEPPIWHLPVRHHLAAVLLEAGRADEAEARYREDLKRFPSNGWSLFGLQQALKAQNKDAEAAEAEQNFRDAWAESDVTLTASRF